MVATAVTTTSCCCCSNVRALLSPMQLTSTGGAPWWCRQAPQTDQEALLTLTLTMCAVKPSQEASGIINFAHVDGKDNHPAAPYQRKSFVQGMVFAFFDFLACQILRMLMVGSHIVERGHSVACCGLSALCSPIHPWVCCWMQQTCRRFSAR